MKPISYQECYEILSLPSDIKWEQANMHYRKMVQHWHPDRYDGEDPDLAQRRFIELTTAFNKLRDYHQAHKCLPFSGDGIGFSNASNDESFDTKSDSAASGIRRWFSSEADMDASITHRDIRNGKSTPSKKKKFRIPPALTYFGLILAAGAMVLTLFASMDNSDLQDYKLDERINFASELYGQPENGAQ